MKQTTDEDWAQRVADVFEQVVKMPDPDARAEYMLQAIAGDESLRHEVESLLAASQQGHDLTKKLRRAARGTTSHNLAQAGAQSSQNGSLDAPTQPDRIGLCLGDDGRYKVTEKIGEGGFGQVFRALDRRTGREVAVKLLHKQLLNDETLKDYYLKKFFDNHLRAINRINHPGVPMITDLGLTSDGEPFVIMGLIRGRNLRELLRSGDAIDAPGIILQVAEILEAAHRARVVHRDVKPENIMVSDNGESKLRVWVLDFEIAAIIESGLLRSTHSMAGTPRYMAPEQAAGAPPIPASDQYALALISCEMLTGNKPQQNRSLTEQVATLPPTVRQVLSRAVSPDPIHRFPKITEFARDLAAALSLANGQSMEDNYKTRPISSLSSAPPPQQNNELSAQHLRGGRVFAAIICALLVIAVITSLTLWPSTAELSYYLTVQKYTNKGPTGQERRFAGKTIQLSNDECIQIYVSQAEPGNLYLIGELREGDADAEPSYHLLEAQRIGEAVSSSLPMKLPQANPLMPRKIPKPGLRERLWLVWSAKQESVLEDARTLINPTNQGQLQAKEQMEWVRAHLNSFSASVQVVTNHGQDLTRVWGQTNLLTVPIDIQEQAALPDLRN